ncbi:alpha/beta hydrolase family protein [Spirosoma luteum]|uniref:alpha/beta hydrolase family protein n=1 Tax=Spirosoma luteum TaxID=431553 RepID=UPI00036F97F6|nr:alpha/beta hydrolase [Spirosoma luteum]
MPTKDEVIERRGLELKDDPKVISPPILGFPLYACSTVVKVLSFIPQAGIDVEINGAVIVSVTVGFPEPDGAIIPIPGALIAGQVVRARQRSASAISGWSNSVTVGSHKEDFPAGLPRPVINPAPVYKCGIRTGVSNLLIGSNAWITADGSTVGSANGSREQQGINIAPAYSLGRKVVAQAELCADKSPLSAEEITVNAAYPLPTPTFDPAYQGATQLRINNVANGARVKLEIDGLSQGTSGCWGGSLYWNLGTPLGAGASLKATQSLCADQPSSTGQGTVNPCSALPPPDVAPAQIGDTFIRLTNYVVGALVKVYVNNVKVGESSGSIIPLTQAVAFGNTVLVEQIVGTCRSQLLTIVQVRCVAPPLSFDPSYLNLFPVGSRTYSDGRRKGIVFYPAETDGDQAKFNKRVAALGRVPIIFIAHGNHNPADPSYLGYDYFQKDLARMGFIVVSIDCNEFNGYSGGVSNIEDRADLIIDNIAYFQSLDASSGSVFENKIDFKKTGLMGHSRGGDAVVMVPEVIPLAGVTLKSVLALAPTDFRWWINGTTTVPKKYEFMTVLPAGDGDVTGNEGARFYDQARPSGYKSQLYVHNTSHNLFNRQWLSNDGQPMGVIVSRYQHERILSVYGCALFRNTLKGHATTQFLAGYALPSGALTDRVHLSFEKAKMPPIDNFEDGNGIGTNSMGGPNAAVSLGANEYSFRQVTSGVFNPTFYGNSEGMVLNDQNTNGTFTLTFKETLNLKGKEIWLRAAEVNTNGALTGGPTGFQLGLKDASGVTVFIDSDGVGGLPRPYDRPSVKKTMLKTLRFPVSCFKAASRRFKETDVVALVIKCNRPSRQPALAFDDIQLVK